MCYFILSQSIRKILYSLVTDLIVTEVKFGECLKKTVSEWMNKKKIGMDCVTLFCCRAFARYRAPSVPILL